MRRLPNPLVLLVLSIIVVVATATISAPASAQAGTPPLRAGTRVRVTSAQWKSNELVGTIEQSRGDSLFVRVSGHDTSVAVAVSAIRKLDVSQGQRSRPWRGLGVGAGVGGVIGALWGLSITPDKRGMIVNTRGEQAMVLGISMAIIGAPVGLVTGVLTKSEGWKAVAPPEGRVRIGMAPTQSGLAMRGRLTF
ncbi:MAG TPA: hypothetical protein VE869_01235 [Gemmatimonas sp.]|nr:hypothetical protein [Gemmatimonas sp.]